MRTRQSIAAIAASAFVLASASPVAAVPGDKDCKDFKSQKEAQKFFKKKGGPKEDPHQLDDDNDGKACETYDYD